MGVNNGGNPRRTTTQNRKGATGQRDASKALSPNGHTARFLYLILKQTDIKHISWEKVADGTGLPTAKSAKGRYGRFKRQIESQILGDLIQVKREKLEDNDAMEHSGLDTQPSGSIGTSNASADGRRRIKTEPGTTLNIKQEPGQTSSTFRDDSDDEDMFDTPSSSASSAFIKAEAGLDYDFSDSLIKREKIVDEDIPQSLGLLQSEFYHSSPPLPCSSTQTPSLHARRPMTPSSPPFSSPYRPTHPSPLARYRYSGYRNPWEAGRSMVPGYQSSIFDTRPAKRAQNSNSGKSGKGSAEEPVDLDDW